MRSITGTSTHVAVALLALSLLSACRPAARQSAVDRLQPCPAREGLTDAYCGSLTVFENRQTRTGRTIDLRIVVLPAAARDARPDPVFFLAGGPGQGAAKMARPIREVFRRLQDTRDIVLVDQRGTGKSHPLECASDDESLRGINESDEQGFARLRRCLAGYDADPRLYTTTIAMDDLDDVRVFLGYESINLYGGSYGTRAALAYLRQHEAHVRAVVLDGVAPTDMRLPLFFGRDAQRSLDRLLADCAADGACAGKYPALGDRLSALFGRLERSPARVRLVHPRTGIAEEVTIEPRFVANILAGALYAPLTASLLPEIIARADAGDFQGMLALGMVGDGAEENMSVGMQLSVLCAEDYPRITPEQSAAESTGTVFARYLLASRMKACEFWPKGEVALAYYEPVASSVPALVLSGDLDPVTPPHRAGYGPWCHRHRVRRVARSPVHPVGHGRRARHLVPRHPASAAVLPHAGRPRPLGVRRHRGSAVIRVEGLRKRFGAVTAVDGVSFTAANGTVTGLLGPNGAGKTTTLRMLYALMTPDEGSIQVDDVDAVADPQGAQARLGVLPDTSGLYPRLTSREHIEYYGRLHGLPAEVLAARTRELLELLDMGAIADRRTGGFSHGERTKVALARALVHNPGNILLDEPTNGLDVMSTRAVRDIIRRLRAEGRSVLFSSHVMQEVSALCDTIVVIAHGRLVASGTPDQLREQTGQRDLEEAFVRLSGLDAEGTR